MLYSAVQYFARLYYCKVDLVWMGPSRSEPLARDVRYTKAKRFLNAPYIISYKYMLPHLISHTVVGLYSPFLTLPPNQVPLYIPPLVTPLSSLLFSSLLSPNLLSSSNFFPCNCPLSSRFHHSLCLLRASSSFRWCSSRCFLRSPASWNHSARALSSSE